MVYSKIKPKKLSKIGNLTNSVHKLSGEEIKLFLEVLSAIMSGVPAPRDARLRYLKEVEKRLRNNGSDFLSKSRVFPTYGLKLLGGDLNGFPIKGFKRAEGKIYPKLFAWYWAELERLSKLNKPSKHDASRAQRVLVVLSFSKMIKTSSVNQIKKGLTDFESRVTEVKIEHSDKVVKNANSILEPDSVVEKTAPKFVADLKETLGYQVDLDTLPGNVDFDSLSTKPSALKEDPLMPEWFGGIQFNVAGAGFEDDEFSYGTKPPPYGKIHVITEAAGKLRLICPYNTPFVHSTGLFARCRAILNCLDGDCSTDQTKGHLLIKRLTSPKHKKGEDDYIISADLSSFSDNTSTAGLRFGLESIGLPDLEEYLFNLPVSLPNGKIITPQKLLMGLKGTFELSSVLHHYAVKLAEIRRYALCGDDLVYLGELSPYMNSIESFDWELNRSKTVISKTAAVFCGEMYWFGFRVSPKIPKVHSIYSNNKLRRASVIFSTVRDSIENLNPIYNRRVVALIMGPFLRCLRKKWRGIVLPSLPSKLRGLGMKPNRPKSLLSYLKNKSILRMCLMSIGVESERVAQNRWFGLPVELGPSQSQTLFGSPFFPSLLEKGAINLRPPKPGKAMVKYVGSLDLYQVFEWYYDDVRLDASQFSAPYDAT